MRTSRVSMGQLAFMALAAGIAAVVVGCSGGSSLTPPSPQSELAMTMNRLSPYVAIATTDAAGTTLLYAGASDEGINAARAASTAAYARAADLPIAVNDAQGIYCVTGTAADGEAAHGIGVSFDAPGAQHAGLAPEEISLAKETVMAVARALALGDVEQATRHGDAPNVPSSLERWFETFEDPLDNPTRAVVGTYWASKAAVESVLKAQKYHLVPKYASGSGYTLSYAIALNYAGVPMQRGLAKNVYAAYRREAGIRRFSDTKWSYFVQKNEPNPELLAYSQPAWWWGQYVYWWHYTH